MKYRLRKPTRHCNWWIEAEGASGWFIVPDSTHKYKVFARWDARKKKKAQKLYKEKIVYL